jgi:hypothetical protein
MPERPRYRNIISDSARWEGFSFRPDDIVISAPAKCGTTWMQMLCAMLVLDAVSFDQPLARISPWLDMQTSSLDALVRDLDVQTHRRMIKTHTPLDGLPYDERVTYVCVGRDPRDAALSFEHHIENLDMGAFMDARAAAIGLADLAELGGPQEPASTDPKTRFWAWAQGEPGTVPATLAGLLHHLSTFWETRGDSNTALFHYSDLLADLPQQLRRLAGVLQIDVTDDRLLEFADAAGFARMKDRADDLVPSAESNLWHSNREFFHRGSSGQWRDLLGAEDLCRYEQRVAELVPPDLAVWAHGGWAATAPPALPVQSVQSQILPAPLGAD